jgi:hypothetical protein
MLIQADTTSKLLILSSFKEPEIVNCRELSRKLTMDKPASSAGWGFRKVEVLNKVNIDQRFLKILALNR